MRYYKRIFLLLFLLLLLGNASEVLRDDAKGARRAGVVTRDGILQLSNVSWHHKYKEYKKSSLTKANDSFIEQRKAKTTNKTKKWPVSVTIMPDTHVNKYDTVEKKSFAVCLTGQLVRLELGSKITNLIIPNLETGHYISLFVLLDNLVDEVKGAKRASRFNAAQALYSRYSGDRLSSFILKQIPEELSSRFEVHVRLEPPIASKYPSRDPWPPVCATKPSHDSVKDERSAWRRFHSHLMWQAGLRQCVLWVQQNEVKKRRFFDFFVRLIDKILISRNISEDIFRLIFY
jgi:hypothetical protein